MSEIANIEAMADEVRRLVARAKGSINKEAATPSHRRRAVRDLEEALEILNELLGDNRQPRHDSAV